MTQSTNPTSYQCQTGRSLLNITQLIRKTITITQFYACLLLTCGARSMQNSHQSTIIIETENLSKRHYG